MLTDKIREDAVKWWGNENAPIAMSDYSSRCEEYIPLKEKENDE